MRSRHLFGKKRYDIWLTLFKNAFAVLKCGKPWTDYEFLCELDITKGLNIGKTYLNRNSGMQFGHEICVNILNDISQEFLAAKFFSIIMDEATDVSHKEQVILYVRFSRHGLIKTKFCGIFRVSRANARQITDGLLDSPRTRFAWQFEGNATSSTDEPRVDESEEPLEASDSSAAGSDDWGSADENPLDKSDGPITRKFLTNVSCQLDKNTCLKKQS